MLFWERVLIRVGGSMEIYTYGVTERGFTMDLWVGKLQDCMKRGRGGEWKRFARRSRITVVCRFLLL